MLGARTGHGNSTSTDSSKDNSEARGKDTTWHTTRGEDNSKQGTNETRTNKRIKKEKKQVSNE
ncbi:hypothetical protein CON62_20660 [Bacillus toyonensis]|nr:hypothetical protein CON62_20660 [Bacillus toyonensis]